MPSQMMRTRSRVLVRRVISPLHAFNFAAITGVTGVATLFYLVNPLTATLGLANIILYAFIYTPLKRYSIVNTWIGAIVGAIPPLMGWAACTNSLDPVTQPGAWALAGLVYAWQFPHFNSLAHTLKSEYAKAGYRMMSVTHPALNARVALRYSLACFPICAAFPMLGVTSAWFGVASCIPNAGMAWASWRFWKAQNKAKEAKWLFWASLVHLPVLLIMLMAAKVGVWTSLKERFQGLTSSSKGTLQPLASGPAIAEHSSLSVIVEDR